VEGCEAPGAVWHRGGRGRAGRAHVGSQRVTARAHGGSGLWGGDTHDTRMDGGAASLPGRPASPGLRGGSGATRATRACAHAGHLLKHGEVFRSPGRRGGHASVPGGGLAAARRASSPLLF